MSAFSVTAVRACLVFCLLSFLPGGVAAQHPYVYLVNASDCAQAPHKRALTGFRVQGKRGIITALHGVADSRTITVTSIDGKLRDSLVTIYEVDIEHDLARLSSPAFERLPAEGFDVAPRVNVKPYSPMRVIGYPLNVDLEDLTLPLTTGDPSIKVLGRLVDATTRNRLIVRGSPVPTLSVLYLVGPLHPGHSGAPILDGKGRLIGVGNGGLKVFSGIGWAIRWQSLVWKPARGNSRLEQLKRLASVGLFSFDIDPQAAQERLLSGIKNDTEEIKKNTAKAVELLKKMSSNGVERINGSLIFGKIDVDTEHGYIMEAIYASRKFSVYAQPISSIELISNKYREDAIIYFDVTNQNRMETRIINLYVKVEQYYDVKIVNISPIASKGYGTIEEYMCNIQPTVGLYKCVQFSKRYDFIKLASGELVRFGINVNTKTQGIYKLSVHIEYSIGGKIYTIEVGRLDELVGFFGSSP